MSLSPTQSIDPSETRIDCRCAVLTDPEEIFALRDEWTDLLLHSRVPNVFVSWEWITTWMRTLGQRVEPCVVVLRRADDNVLVGLAPLCRSGSRYPLGLRTMGLMGTGVGADHMAFISRADIDKRVYAALAGHLLAMGGWDVLELSRLEETFADQVAELFQRTRGRFAYASTVADLCPFIPLPKTWQEYSRVMHQRAELGRRWRRLQEKSDVVIQRVQYADELDDAWQALLRLHQGRRQAVGGRSAFLAPHARAFHQQFVRAAFNRGWLRLYLLRVGGRCVAAEYCLHVAERVFDFQGGFDMDWARYWVRSILTAHAIRTAIEEGATEYDFSRGAEPYKLQRWGAITRRDISLVAWRRHARVSLTMAVRGWGRTVRNRARRRMAAVADTDSHAAGSQA